MAMDPGRGESERGATALFRSAAQRELLAVARAVRALLGGSEAEFLKVGRELSDLAERASRVVSMAHSSVSAASAGADARAAKDIHDDVAAIQGVLARNHEAAGEGAQRLRALSRAIARILAFGGELARVTQALRTLGLLTRMEGSRAGLEGSGFVDVSADVSQLSEEIRSKFDVVLERAAPLRSLLLRASDQSQALRNPDVGLLGDVARAVERLVAMNRAAQRTVERVARAMDEITLGLGQIVVSLQSHDITRQQLEHVAEALESAASAVERAPDASAVQLVTGDASALQLYQIRHARGEILGAVERLVTGLTELADRVRGVEADLDQISVDGADVLTAIGARLNGALDILRVSGRRTEAISTSTAQVTVVVGEMTPFIHDIEAIGEKVKLIAANARVKSARTGDAGRALGVLAAQIQTVADETHTHTAAVSEVLSDAAEEATALRDTVAHVLGDGGSRAEAIASNLLAVLRRLGEADEALRRGVEEVGRESRRLQESAHGIARAITYHLRARQVLEEAERRMGGLAAAATRGLRPAERATRAARLRAEMARYTMESERLVHARSLGGQEGTASAAPAAEADGLGANVELF